jgi:prophage antirepressor-like protein
MENQIQKVPDTKVQIFTHVLFGNIRIILDDSGNPFFVGRDVAISLGYSKPENAITQHVDKEDTLKQGIPDNQGFIQNTTIVNESGLYSLVFGSKLPTAKKFKNWVTSEVLPAIRKHGGYLTQQKVEEVLLSPDTIIKLATALKEERKKAEQLELSLKTTNSECRRLIKLQDENYPKTKYYDEVMQSKNLISTNVIAKELGMSAVTLNKKLHELGVIYKSGGTWVLYHKYQNKGYTATQTYLYKDNTGNDCTAIHTYWTQQGRQFIHDLLK